MPTRASHRTRAWLTLLRPANVATAAADVLAGASISGVVLSPDAVVPDSVGWLLASTACLYAGGVVLNDVFDRHVDATERPERPIPSGAVTPRSAAVAGGVLLAGGMAAAANAGQPSAIIAALTAAAVLVYDAWAKRHPVAGPVTMGVCRALNLLLGMAAVPSALSAGWPLAGIPLVYISSVTVVSRGEVHGSARAVLRLASTLVVGVVLTLAAIVTMTGTAGSLHSTAQHGQGVRALWGLCLVGWLGWRVVPAFSRAAATGAPADIRRAVRTGVLSLVLVDAVLAASYAGIMNSLAVLAAGLMAWWLARLFAVT